VSSTDAQNIQAGTHSIGIKNNNGSQEMNATMATQVEWGFCEKPFFYHGIAGLSIGVVGFFISLFFAGRMSSKSVRNAGSGSHGV
jgi:hypothetical protein